jgi:uncharacterized protein
MPLSKQDLFQLETWLASPMFKGQAMPIDKLQGFLCAVISGPELIPPSVWLPEALGPEPEYDSLDQAREVMNLLMTFYNDVATGLQEDRPPKLILKPISEMDQNPDYQTWCEGYILGWGLFTEEWLRPGNEALKKLTFPILYLSGAFQEDAERKGKEYVADEEDLKVRQECADVLPQSVRAIYDFWLSKRKAAPIKRDVAKVGRNDRCPCGSGKKLKACCGSPQRLQ